MQSKLDRALIPCLALTALCCGASIAPCQNLPQPTRLWSAGPLIAEPASTVRPGGSSSATRSVVFAGDRIVLAARKQQAESAPQPVFELVSLDVQTGEIRNTREISSPDLSLFATSDAHVIISGSTTVMRLTPDLKDAGTFGGPATVLRIDNISPDGSTLGNKTNPGFELIDAKTLQSSRLTDSPAVDASVNSKGFVTNNQRWTGTYPRDTSFITYVDAKGNYLIYHSRCGGRPQFISDSLILEPGCKNPIVINTSGDLIKSLPLTGDISFAGAAQNGTRFALRIPEFSSDHTLQSERFVIYSTETWKPVGEVGPDYIGDDQAWTAFSPDGSMFVVGSHVRLALYQIP